MKRVAFVVLIFNSLLNAGCRELVEDIEYNAWVLEHHIDYHHKEETLNTVKILNGLLDGYNQNCLAYGKYNKDVINYMRKQLNQITNSIRKVKSE